MRQNILKTTVLALALLLPMAAFAAESGDGMSNTTGATANDGTTASDGNNGAKDVGGPTDKGCDPMGRPSASGACSQKN